MTTTLTLIVYGIGIVTGLLLAHAYHTIITPTRRGKGRRATPAKRATRTVKPSAVPEMKDSKRKQQVQQASPWAGPVKKAAPRPTVDQARQMLADDAYASLLDTDADGESAAIKYNVVRYTNEQYKHRATTDEDVPTTPNSE